MEPKRLQSVLETLLFVYGEPLSLERLAEILQEKPEEVRQGLAELSQELETNRARGLCLVESNQRFQLGTKPENHEYVERLAKRDFQEELTPALLEVLTIVLYRSPLARSEIDYIRGVNSSYAVRNLLLRGLIEREAGKDGQRFFVYYPSFELLRFLGVSHVTELPGYEELHKKYQEILAADKARVEQINKFIPDEELGE